MVGTVIGARPQFIKAAVLSKHLADAGIKEVIIHTGQHYDYKMSEVFFTELGLPGAEINLNVGSSSHGAQTAEILAGIEKYLIQFKKGITHVLLYGDTNSTLAGAIAASKLNIPIVHVEAGLRSYNREMPEEINRVVTDHLSSLLFCSSDEGVRNLEKEGIAGNVYVSGDIMLDAFNTYSEIAHKKFDLKKILPPGIANNYMLLTIHRPVNTDNISNLTEILAALGEVKTDIVWPVHPRNKATLSKLNVPQNVRLFEPFSYFEMMVVLHGAKRVLTDSGGLQKEAYWAKKPCITIRSETEWVETLHDNWNILASPERTAIREAANIDVDRSSWTELYGNGYAGKFISKVIGASIAKVQTAGSEI
ncbi:MAG: UDP-N-acetylglucosamine 2-epimerase (non-hydrolyzing) [Chitinophagaceae bacterium]|nr:UDP-N-acetylglucosamine 2-epimerase (non-hydrolyzing) [Chitinophagaceae bacterium]